MRGIDIRKAFETWLRWRSSGGWYTGGELRSTLGPLTGVRWVTCPVCHGDARGIPMMVWLKRKWLQCPKCFGERVVKADKLNERVTAKPYPCEACYDERTSRSAGEIAGHTCHRCKGSGERVMAQLEVNPAGIRGTRRYGVNEDPDPTSMHLDRIVAGWSQSSLTFALYRIVIMEYCWSGTQEMKAAEIGKSREWFKKTLTIAHYRAEEALKIAV